MSILGKLVNAAGQAVFAGVNAATAIDGAATSMEEPLERVEIDYSEFDSESISSAFNYAILKYGNSICNEPDRLKNILSDLAPNSCAYSAHPTGRQYRSS